MIAAFMNTVEDQPPQSWWWCRRCHAFVDVKDAGEPYPQGECGHRSLEWREPVAESSLEMRSVRGPKPSPIVFEAKPVLTYKRLPKEQRYTLKEMFEKGYFRCTHCRELTRRRADECCVLCGSSQVEFTPPAVQEETP